MYNSPYKNAFDCIVKTTQKEGIKAFYRSYFTQLNMNIPFQCTHLVTYDLMQSYLNKRREYNPLSHCISGAVSGALAAAITTPLDVCKTLINTQECCNPDEKCKQINTSSISNNNNNNTKINFNLLLRRTVLLHSQSMATLTRASSLSDAVQIIYRTEGYRGFFKGIVPRTVFQIPGTAVSWSVYEYFKHKLKKNNAN